MRPFSRRDRSNEPASLPTQTPPADRGGAWCFDADAMSPTSTAAAVPPPATALRRLQERARYYFAHPSYSVRIRVALVLIAVIAAYHYTLLTLLSSLGLDTPLAYLGLVPFMALGIAAMRVRPRSDEPDIHDRQVDFIVGIPLLALALGMVIYLPSRLSTLFWIYRIDVVSLPLFVAGIVTVVFGVRTMWRLRFPIGFLLLAWPLPYTIALDKGLDSATVLTVDALKWSLSWVPVDTVWTPGSDGSLFAIGSGAEAFTVSVAAACAGVNSVVGFLLVGIAFAAIVEGKRIPKLLWLVSGLLLIWVLNVARILMIFWIGAVYGERVAIDGLHPVIGLILFCFGVVVMIATMGLFGLRVSGAKVRMSGRERRRIRRTGGPTTSAPVIVTAAPTKATRPRWVISNRLRTAGTLTVAVALVLGVANAGMRQYQLVAGDLGAPRLAAFSTTPAALPDYSVAQIASYDWATRFFGDDSSWLRFQYAGASTTGQSQQPVIADVVSTTKLGRFSTYGIEACYKFHGYSIASKEGYDLGGGIQGELITYIDPKADRAWNALWWIWPVKEGDTTRYERVTLLTPSNAAQLSDSAPDSDVRQVSGPIQNASVTETDGRAELKAGHEYLVDFGNTLVQSQSAAPTASTTNAAG